MGLESKETAYPKLPIPGSPKANGREPKTCLDCVFNYKLGCFDDNHALFCVGARPHL
jgi:hypothetical protein